MLNCSVKNNYSPDLYAAFRYHETHKIPQNTELINMWLLSRSSVTNHHKMLRKCIFVWEGSCMLCLFIFMFVTNSWRSNTYLCSWHNEAHWFYKCITQTWTHTHTHTHTHTYRRRGQVWSRRTAAWACRGWIGKASHGHWSSCEEHRHTHLTSCISINTVHYNVRQLSRSFKPSQLHPTITII